MVCNSYMPIHEKIADILGLTETQRTAIRFRDFALARKLGVSTTNYLLVIV